MTEDDYKELEMYEEKVLQLNKEIAALEEKKKQLRKKAALAKILQEE